MSAMATLRLLLPRLREVAALQSTFFAPCWFLAATGYPCPFCGGTRSLELALNGRCFEALTLSPLGPLIVMGSLGVSLWALACAASCRELGLNRVLQYSSRVVWWRLGLGTLLSLWLLVIACHRMNSLEI